MTDPLAPDAEYVKLTGDEDSGVAHYGAEPHDGEPYGAEPHDAGSCGDEDSSVRGFALYVGMSESKARANGLELGDIVSALREALVRRVPDVESQALAVVAPIDESAGDLEVVLLASGRRTNAAGGASPGHVPPGRVPAGRAPAGHAPRDGAPSSAEPEDAAVVIDLARHRVLVDDQDLRLTFKEFALLKQFVDHPGRTISRARLRDVASASDGADVNDRTIDVRIRRLRIKLGDYPDLIRTVPGRGYRFDPRSDVAVLAR